jgi:uncharacterized membrane protein
MTAIGFILLALGSVLFSIFPPRNGAFDRRDVGPAMALIGICLIAVGVAKYLWWVMP